MSENSKQRKSIRTITPSLLLLFAIGCESTMVSPEYDDYDNSDTTYTEYLETDTIETDTIDFEYNDDDGLPWIPPPFFPSDSLDDSIPEFPDSAYVDSLWYLYPVDTSIECITLEGFDCSMP